MGPGPMGRLHVGIPVLLFPCVALLFPGAVPCQHQIGLRSLRQKGSVIQHQMGHPMLPWDPAVAACIQQGAIRATPKDNRAMPRDNRENNMPNK